VSQVHGTDAMDPGSCSIVEVTMVQKCCMYHSKAQPYDVPPNGCTCTQADT
jgi:hypothetical protein